MHKRKDEACLAQQEGVRDSVYILWTTFESISEVRGTPLLSVQRPAGLLVSPQEISASNPSSQMRTYLANLLFIASRSREINSEHEDILQRHESNLIFPNLNGKGMKSKPLHHQRSVFVCFDAEAL